MFNPKIIGCVSVTQDRRLKRRHKANLHGMYVLPKHRGEGFGKHLIEKVLELSRKINELEEIQLTVATQNWRAIELYEKFGFKRQWKEEKALKIEDDYVDAHHMSLTLK